jgi:hypothetical protein
MLRLWKFVWNGKNREILSWLGGGAVIIVAGTWTLVTYLDGDKSGAWRNGWQIIC